MASIGSGYDLSADTFSPDGRLFQVEYAQKAVDNSGTAVGIQCKDGVVLGVEKLLVSKMLEAGSNSRIFKLDRQCGAVIAGNLPDGRHLMNEAQSYASQNRSTFGVPITGDTLTSRVAYFAHIYTLYGGARPFGSSALMASYGDDGPLLYLIDTTGQRHPFTAVAVGKGRTQAKTLLEKLLEKSPDMTCREALQELANIIYEVHDQGKDRVWELELAWVTSETKVFEKVPKDLAAEVAAKAEEATKDKERD